MPLVFGFEVFSVAVEMYFKIFITPTKLYIIIVLSDIIKQFYFLRPHIYLRVNLYI